MNPSMTRRIEGTTEQQKAQQLCAAANYILRLKQNTRLNAEQRMQLLRALATR